jgi:hypothetical protein
MSIFDFDINYVADKLLPPELRKPIRFAWIKVLLAGLREKYQNIFGLTNSFKRGSFCSPWTSAGTWGAGVNVKVGIKRYKALQTNSGNFPPSSPQFWTLIADDFVGSDARVKFNAVKITFEYALNLYLNTSPTATPTIYISTNNLANPTMMLNQVSPSPLSLMPNNSVFTQYYMAQNSTYTNASVNYTIFVPILVWNSLASNNNDREQVVRSIADRYNMAGKIYNVTPY